MVSTRNLDFNAFYCAAKLLSGGDDPYRYAPLYACEAANLHPLVHGAVVPAPLPPYAIAWFVPLTWLTFAQASFLWWLVLIASALVVAWAIVELTGLSLVLVAACTIPAILLEALNFGALAPVPIALLCAAAVAVERGRPALAAALLGLTCAEPHVALPSLIAAFLFLPTLRAPLLAALALLVALPTLLPHSFALTGEYFAHVIPAHAASEISNVRQYSLTTALYNAGVREGSALFVGSLQYAAFAVVGIVAAWFLAPSLRPAVVLAPVAFAVAGGTFIHATQIAGALPLALLLAARQRSAVAWTAVALLAVPWELFSDVATAGSPSPFTAVAVVPPDAWAEAAWRRLSDQMPVPRFWWLSHVPTYLGLALTYVGAYRARERR